MKSPEEIQRHMSTLAFAFSYSDPDFAGDRAGTLYQALVVLVDEVSRRGVDRDKLRLLLSRSAWSDQPPVPGATQPSACHPARSKQSDIDILNNLGSKTKHNRKD